MCIESISFGSCRLSMSIDDTAVIRTGRLPLQKLKTSLATLFASIKYNSAIHIDSCISQALVTSTMRALQSVYEIWGALAATGFF